MLSRNNMLSGNPYQTCLGSCQTKHDLALQYHQLRTQVQAVHVSCHRHPPQWLWNMNPACWVKKKKDPSDWGNLFATPCLQQKSNDWLLGKINFLVGPQEPLLATVKRRKLAWFGHVTHHDSLSTTIFQGTLKVGDAVVSRGNTGWTISKNRHPYPGQICSQWRPVEKTGWGSLLNRPLCPPDDPIRKWTEHEMN